MAGAVEFVISERDYLGAARDAFLVWLRSRAGKRRIGFTTLFWAALGFGFGWMDAGPSTAALLCLLLGVGGLLFQGLVYALCYLRLPRRAGRLYRQHSRLDEPVSIGWGDFGLHFQSPNADVRHSWGDIYQWADGKNALLLYQNEQIYNFVPRRAVDAEAGADLKASLESAGVPRG
jgi:YcxB-like protein